MKDVNIKRTLQEIGRTFGVGRERIRYLEANTLNKIVKYEESFRKIL